jgi:LytS/YehU family sensor histidine kinase
MLVMNLKASVYVYLFYDNIIFSENLWTWNPVLITGLRHMSIWLLGYHAYHFYIKELETAKTNAKLSLLTKEIQMDHLKSQLNPHFLFNSLNTIKALVIENPLGSRRAIDLLADLLRSSLYQNNDNIRPLSNEIALTMDYIELEKLRYEEQLHVEMAVDERLNDAYIPSFSLQQLIENAIKHGIDKQVGGGTIKISIESVDSFLVIKVINPGTLNLEYNNGLGLANLRERIALKYEGKAVFRIRANSNNTIEVSLKIPINEQ